MAPRVKSLLDILEDKILIGDECWEWTAHTVDGYGKFQGHRGGIRTEIRAHRAVYELLVGPIPEGLELDHTCHNQDESCAGGPTCPHRRCVNPGHLTPKTTRDNVLSGRNFSAVNAAKTHCIRGHAYDAENTYTTPQGYRNCRACRKRGRG